MTVIKKAEIEADIHETKPDIICLTEVLPKNYKYKISEESLKIQGYTLHNCGLKNRGVCPYTANHLIANQIHFKTNYEDAVWCLATIKNKKILISCIYRSPSNTPEKNYELLCMLEETSKINANNTVICGDFNCKEIDWITRKINCSETHHASKIYDKINDLFLHQKILEPTRYRNDETPSLLDWVLCDEEDLIEEVTLHPPVQSSDHVVIRFQINVIYTEPENIPRYQYYKGNYENMRTEIKNENWEEIFRNKNVQQTWDLFQDKISGLIERNIPKKKFTNNHKPPWTNREIQSAIKKKRKAWDQYKRSKKFNSKEEIDLKWIEYTKKRNKVTELVAIAKTEYENKIVKEEKNNPKTFWSYVNKNSNTSNNIPDLISEDGQTFCDDLGKADVLNRFFSSVFTDEDLNNIPEINKQTNAVLEDIEFTENKIISMLKKMNSSKAPGPDNIHGKVLKECSEFIAHPLNLIFNKSMSEGKLPCQWKEAHVKPLFKKGKRSLPANYRPVSLTSLCCKLLERIIKVDVTKHLIDLGLITDDQHGFREGRSCCTQLLQIMEIWTDMFDHGQAWDCIYLDFAKAFDSVPHKRLLNKLQAYGITGKKLKWVEDFLTDRQQRVIVAQEKSSWTKVMSGIPQGSVLGPLLFIVFINDLPSVAVNSLMKIFADDTKVFKAISTIQDAEDLQTDIDKLTLWAKKWQLPYNELKCKVIHLGKRNINHNYTMNGYNLQTDTEEKDLGVTFDTNLTFQPHIGNIISKANSRVGIIKRTFNKLNEENFKIL